MAIRIERPNSKGQLIRTYAMKRYCDCGAEYRVSLRGAYSELWYVCDECEIEERGTVWDEMNADDIELKRQIKRKD